MNRRRTSGTARTPWWPWLVLALGLAPAAVATGGLLAELWWVGELCIHWAGHAAIGCLLIAGALARPRPWWSGGFVLLGTAVGLMVLPATWRPRAEDTPGTPLRVAHGNLYLYNDKTLRPAAVASVLASDPDIASLAEAVESEDRPHCDPVRWPHQVWAEQTNRYWRDSVALLSRWPIVHHETHDQDAQPYLVATLDVQGRPLHVIVLHTLSPRTAEQSAGRFRQLAHVAATVRGLNATVQAPVLVLGDFNCTVRSPAWEPLTEAGLRTATSEPATWHSGLGPAGIAIDHVLVRGLGLVPPMAFTIPGSDHCGLASSITLPP